MSELLRRRTTTPEAPKTEAPVAKKSNVGAKTLPTSTEFVPTGSTLLNCAISDDPFGGWKIGKIANLVGDSSAGKSMLAVTSLAEVALHPKFDKFRLIYDEPEAAMEFNMSHLFGSDFSDRVELEYTSDTIQDFYSNLLRVIKADRPFIYILDSLDSLTGKDESQRAHKMAETGKEDGSYKLEKQKLLSELLRVTARDIRDKEGLLIIVSQTRDNIGFGYKDKTRSGGRALEFYSSYEMWLSITQTIKKRDRSVGVASKIKVTKNKMTGKSREVPIEIYYDYGIDDLGMNIDFLVEEGVWPLTKQTIDATHFGMKGTRQTLINQIEKDYDIEIEVRKLVGEAWKTIEDAIKLNRLPKYRERRE